MFETSTATNELTPVISFTLFSNSTNTTSTNRNTTRNLIQNINNFNNQSQNISNPANTSLYHIKTSLYPFNHSNTSTVIPQASSNKVPRRRQ